MPCCDNTFYSSVLDCEDVKEEIEMLKIRRKALSDAIAAFISNDFLLEYNINTGQTTQRVKREDFSKIQAAYNTVADRIIELTHAYKASCGNWVGSSFR